MTHEEIFDLFKYQFSLLDSKIEDWFPNGANSIRVRCFDRCDVVYTYQSPTNWRLETVESFVSDLEKISFS